MKREERVCEERESEDDMKREERMCKERERRLYEERVCEERRENQKRDCTHYLAAPDSARETVHSCGEINIKYVKL